MSAALRTVCGVMVQHSRVLLLRRKERSAYGLWCLPGGKIEADESPDDALDRELKEEIGIEVIEKVCFLHLKRHTPRSLEMYVYHILSFCGALTNVEQHQWTWAAQSDLEDYPSYLLNQRVSAYLRSHPLSTSRGIDAQRSSIMLEACDGW